jgi:hypothetical protein
LLLSELSGQFEDDGLVVVALVGLAADVGAQVVAAQVAESAAFLRAAFFSGHAAEGFLVVTGVFSDFHKLFHFVDCFKG